MCIYVNTYICVKTSLEKEESYCHNLVAEVQIHILVVKKFTSTETRGDSALKYKDCRTNE